MQAAWYDLRTRFVIMNYDHFARSHAYARRNGYTGAYDEYVKLQYETYRDTVRLCGIKKPMTFEQWKDVNHEY